MSYIPDSSRRLTHIWRFMLAIPILWVAQQTAPWAAAPSTPERPCTQGELDSMLMAWFAPLPASGDVEIFFTFDRPKKPRAEIEKEVRDMVARDKARGEPIPDWEDYYKMNVESRVESYSQPVLQRERFRTKGAARRCERAWITDGTVITPQSPFDTTYIQPGSRADGDRRYYKYDHWAANEEQRKYFEKYGPGSAMTSNYSSYDNIRDIWEELIGIERLLLEILAVDVCDLPSLPLKRVPEARELPLNPQKIQNLLADKGSFQIRVSEFDVDGEKRLRIRFLLPKGWGLLAAKELSPCAEIVVKAADFRAVYEQRIIDTDGNETVVVTADGFDDQGIPKEKTWVKRLPDGQHETTSYAILNAKINIEIPAAEFEFHPPEGYLVDVMGPDGRPIKTESEASPPPQLEKKPVANRLWGLNLLAVLVLAAFTIRKLILRRQSDVGGGATP